MHPRSGAFRLFRRELVAAADEVHDPSISIDVLLSWATNRIEDVAVSYDERAGGGPATPPASCCATQRT